MRLHARLLLVTLVSLAIAITTTAVLSPAEADRKEVLANPASTRAPNPPPDARTAWRDVLTADMTLGSEVMPHGTTSRWAYKPRMNQWADPVAKGMTAVLPWGQLYECASGNPQPAARVEIRDIEAWWKNKNTRDWTRINYGRGVGGYWYQESYSTDAHNTSNKVVLPDGGVTVTAGNGHNFHFWDKRKTIDPRLVAGYIAKVRARLYPGSYNTDGAAPCYTLSMGADWWKNLTAQHSPDWSNNFDIGIGRFKEVRPRWRVYTMSTTRTGDLPLPVRDRVHEFR